MTKCAPLDPESEGEGKLFCNRTMAIKQNKSASEGSRLRSPPGFVSPFKLCKNIEASMEKALTGVARFEAERRIIDFSQSVQPVGK